MTITSIGKILLVKLYLYNTVRVRDLTTKLLSLVGIKSCSHILSSMTCTVQNESRWPFINFIITYLNFKCKNWTRGDLYK